MAREMKESCVSCFGMVPEDWKIVKLKSILSLRSVKSGRVGELLSVYLDRGVIAYTDSDGQQVHKPSLDMANYQVVQNGDFVLNNQQAWRGSVGVSTFNGIISPAYFVYDISESCDPDYMNYLFRDQCMVQQYEVASRGVGTIQRNLFAPWLMNSWVVLPSLEAQKEIAVYLNAKCAEIDALMADVQAQIETLEQYKRSVITEAVTGSVLTPIQKVKTGDSYWPELPSNWALRDNKYIFEILKRIAGREGYNVLSITHKGIKIKNIESNEGQIAANYSGYQFVYPGDFAMNGLDLNAGWCDISELFGVTSPDYRVFHLRDITQYNANFYRYVIQLCYMNKTFYALTQGVTESYRRLSTDTFNNFRVPVPPYEEQMAIAQFLDTKCAEIDAIIDGKRQQLAVLEEYKKSVIFEYVTGKKEVPISCPQSAMKQ